jgi:hypothetical protein
LLKPDFRRFSGTVEEVSQGDVVGAVNKFQKGQVRLYYAIFKPSPPFLTKRRPKVNFCPPHVGVSIFQDRVHSHYIHTPMPGESYLGSWAGDIPDDDEDEFSLEEIFPLYVVENAEYKRLGQRIPSMEVPPMGFLAQTTKDVELLHKFCDDNFPDLQRMWELYRKVRNNAYDVPY